MPTGYTLIAPDGTRYQLDMQGNVSSIRFADGAQWLISDAGITAVSAANSSTLAGRIDFLRDAEGRISRITYPDAQGASSAIAYRFGSDGNLTLVRNLNDTGLGTPIAYHTNGQPVTEPLTANLGAVVNWNSGSANAWSGTLNADQSVTLAFAVRDSEIASTIHTPGGHGAVIIALESALPDNAMLQVSGAQIIGTATVHGKKTQFLRVTESGVKLIRISGAGLADIRLSLAGDLNRDGAVDGTDASLWEQSRINQTAAGDINGDGLINAADRQALYANTGFKANQAPVTIGSLPPLKTHTDLGLTSALARIAEDLEGDTVFWRILGSTHGTARLSADGHTLSFTPETGYTGEATLTLQADDGFATGAPIELKVNVSGAKLLQIHLTQLPSLFAGQFAQLQATADFEDEKGVAITSGTYLNASVIDLAGMGSVSGNAVQVDDQLDVVRANTQGAALVIVRRVDADGRLVQAVQSMNIKTASGSNDDTDNEGDSFSVEPDVYPGTLTLIPGGTRQLKVHLIDSGNGQQTDIHDASQIEFVGAPEQVETWLDPSTQLPLIDPDTGEILLDPNTGETLTYVTPAKPEVRSGTRYVVSDESIATVSEDGLITALKTGRVTISVVHLQSVTDETGAISQQVIGQTDIRLNVDAAKIVAAGVGITIAADQGGAVQATTGETVLIGAGALSQDVAVSINRIELANIQAETGMDLPVPEAVQVVAAFRINIGDQASNTPLQLAIPLQDTSNLQAGEEVLFFKKGQALQPDGSFKDIWWIIDNGYIGADGIARTASPPYVGLEESGEYLVGKKFPGVVTSEFELWGNPGEWLTLDNVGLGFGLTGDLAAKMVTGSIVSMICSMAKNVSAASYHFGVPQFAKIDMSVVLAGERFRLNLGNYLPPAPTPWGNVVVPNITDATITEDNQFKITISNPDPGQFKGQLMLRMVFDNGTTQDAWDEARSGDLSGVVTVTPPTGIAIGSVGWQLVRHISTEQLKGTGSFTDGDPLEFAGSVARITPRPHMAATLTRTGVEFIRQTDQTVVASVNLVGYLGAEELAYILGRKVQPIVFTDDLSRVFIAGNKQLIVFDMLTLKVINTYDIPVAKHITSLATVGNLLLIGEGAPGGGNRLLALDISAQNFDPDTGEYKKEPVSLKDTGIETGANGISGMVVGPDGRTLVVSVPTQPDNLNWGPQDFSRRGNVLVFDLNTLNMTTGKITQPVVAKLPDDGKSGKAPMSIMATRDANHFLVANILDYDRGLATLVLTRNAEGAVTGAEMKPIRMAQTDEQLKIDRLDLQRTQSAVLVKVDGVEYALVADDNFFGNDQYWWQMYEAPTFIYTPSGPPIAVGGSANAKKVNVGGKIGVVKDPFGTPEYLGATLPLDGYGVHNLGISEDGKVLIGQLRGLGSANIFDNSPRPSQAHAWNVEALVRAALAQPEQDRLSKHIKLPPNAEQLISKTNQQDSLRNGWPIGTFFDPEFIDVAATGNMGDVIGVDLRELAAKQLLVKEKKLSEADAKKSLDAMSDTDKGLVRGRMGELGNFRLQNADLERLANSTSSMQLVMKNALSKEIYSRSGVDSAFEEGFKKSGVLYFVPNITASGENNDLQKLREGKTLNDKWASFFFICTDYSKTDEDNVVGGAMVTAKDFASVSEFFGDRPLKNPGYSEIKLKGAVGVNQGNDVLDVYRVEQRLKYLGFPAMGTGTTNTLQDFKIDGIFKNEEQAALKLFEKVVRYGQDGANSYKFNLASTGADGVIEAGTSGQAKITKDWLNAYNAPHWMQFFASTPAGRFAASNDRLPGWTNSQTNIRGDGKDVEVFGTSWLFDLMVAKQYGPTALRSGIPFKFNGAVDANLKKTPGMHSTHDLGMSFDLGVSQNIGADAQGNQNEPLSAAVNGLPKTGWSVANALAYTQPLVSGANGSTSGYLPNTRIPANQMNDQVSTMRDLLSMYALTQYDDIQGNGTWDDLAQRVVNGGSALAALFGNGTPAKGLISKIHIGGQTHQLKVNGVLQWISPGVPRMVTENPYRNMNAIFDKLGITSSPVIAHHNHFHLYLRPPAPLVDGHFLLAEASATPDAGPSSIDNNKLVDSAHALLALIHTPLDTGEDIVFTLDVPAVPELPPAIVLAQSTANTSPPANKFDYQLNTCQETEHGDPRSAMRGVNPAGMLSNALSSGYGNAKERQFGIDVKNVKVSLLAPTTHGDIFPQIGNDGLTYFHYDPNPGFVGDDQAIFSAEYAGRRYKIVYKLKVFHSEIVFPSNPDCPFPEVIKLNPKRTSTGPSDPNGIDVTVADLPGATLAQTSSTGPSAQITLDTNAAGHGWYIDYTPYLNDEYLPTSNPLEWIAKPGSEAEGKMDMLTVLLHEYGHALGLDHSADSHDLMASTLLPGVRRLPSAEDLNLMAQLLGITKEIGSASSVPYNPFSPPGTPLPATISLAAFVAARQRRSSLSSALTQFEVAANPTLTNPQFADSQGWSSGGDVAIAAGTATLKETATTQTRLNQAFVVGPNDRFLSFTLSSIALDDVSNAPDDAFEVALIDANTGLSLLGGTGLSHNDAFLNLQADGTEYKASGVTTMKNPDGSRRVLVDLAGIAAGTVVNLSFDLIGFGRGTAATSSHVTVKDLRLGVPQEAHDDTAILTEDAMLDIDIVANDIGVDQPGVLPVLANGPAHGTVELTAEGRFRYIPDANWSGEDSFSYRLSDGNLDSNIAEVKLTVTPVNDAPVLATNTVTLDEDGQASIDLLQGATDIDGDVLTATITTAPQHGSLTQNADGTWTYVPDADWNGSDAIVYEVSDGKLVTSSEIALVVKAVNDAPVIAPRTVTLDEDGQAIIDLLQGTSDVDGDVLNATVVTLPQHGQLTLAADGSFIYVPDANWFGDDSFSFKVSDGLLDSNLALVKLTVLPVNDAPVIAPRTLTLDEDGQALVDLLQGVTDIDGDILTAVVTEGPQHGSFERNADGTWTYVPNANWNGSDSLVYTVSDGQAVTTGHLVFVVRPVNDAPQLSPIARMLQEDGSLVLNLLASTTDVDGDTLSISVGLPGHGQLTQNADSTWTYRPNADYHGSDSFNWTVSDGQAATTGVVHLVINAVNDAPVALGDTVTVNEDGMAAFPFQGSDVDGDVLTGRIVSQPIHGKVVQLSANSFSYVPQANWSGEDSFTYVVNDGQLDSNVATVRLIVTPVADAPTLVLTDSTGPAREVFRTGWESVCDRNGTSTLIQQKELEGWTLLTRPDPSCGGSNGFEIWSTGDKMMNAQNKLCTVSAMTGDGNNWLELNNSGGTMHQTLGIERTVNTLAGATYTLSIDLAGRMGYSADYTKIGIYVDGVRIGGDASTSNLTSLNWQNKTFQFIGKGGAQSIRIVSEATKFDANGRGMMLDDITLSEALPANTGQEDSAIRLSAISAALKDTDGSEMLTLGIEALPVGSLLTDGVHSFMATAGNTTANITGWNLGSLFITPPKDFNGSFTVKVVATATEQANQSGAQSEASLTVKVLAVNDAPQAKNASVTLIEGSSVKIDFASLVSDVDGDLLTLSLANPKQGTLTRNADGTYIYTPKRGYTGSDSFTYTVSDGKQSVTATITVTVQPRPQDDDDDHCHHDNGHHSGFDHSRHHGYAGCEDDKSACITVQSGFGHERDEDRDDERYVGIAQSKNWDQAKTQSIDWNGCAPELGRVKEEDWVADYFTSPGKANRSLAEVTGLMVKAPK